MFKSIHILLMLVVVVASPMLAHGLELAKAAEPAPEDVSDAIKALLSAEALQLKDGDDPQYSFWFVKEVPFKGSPASAKKALDQVENVTLMGVLAVHEEQRDYRDDELYDDIYTMRFGIRPEDGDHQGTSEFLYFLVLTPIGYDETVEGFDDIEELGEVSAEETATGHPIVLSLRPVAEPAVEQPTLTEPVHEHKALQLTLPVVIAGGEKSTMTFEVVYEGIGHL